MSDHNLPLVLDGDKVVGIGSAPAQETLVWLIEWPEDDNVPVRWWNPAYGWMRDANKAIHFARKTDADCFLSTMRFGRHLKVTEHKFCSAAGAPIGYIRIWDEPEISPDFYRTMPTTDIPRTKIVPVYTSPQDTLSHSPAEHAVISAQADVRAATIEECALEALRCDTHELFCMAHPPAIRRDIATRIRALSDAKQPEGK